MEQPHRWKRQNVHFIIKKYKLKLNIGALSTKNVQEYLIKDTLDENDCSWPEGK